MTKYLFNKNNVYNVVIVTDGRFAYEAPVNSNGIDETSGVDLYTDNTLTELITEYAKIKCYLYNMDDIFRDYPDDVFNITGDEALYQSMDEIISVI